MIATFKKETTIWHDCSFQTYPRGYEVRVSYSGMLVTLHFEDDTAPLRVSIDAMFDVLDVQSVPTYSELGLSTDPEVQDIVAVFQGNARHGHGKLIKEVEYDEYMYMVYDS